MWVFCVLQLVGNEWVYYESALHELGKDELSEIVQLIMEWVSLS
jgi:hypothetical protein